MLDNKFKPVPIIGESILIESKGPKETRDFTVEEVLREIELLAKDDDLSVDDFDLEHVEGETDDQENLTYLNILVKKEIAEARGTKKIMYTYTAKGDYGEDIGEMEFTAITRSESDELNPDDFSNITVLARYNENKNQWEKAGVKTISKRVILKIREKSSRKLGKILGKKV